MPKTARDDAEILERLERLEAQVLTQHQEQQDAEALAVVCDVVNDLTNSLVPTGTAEVVRRRTAAADLLKGFDLSKLLGVHKNWNGEDGAINAFTHFERLDRLITAILNKPKLRWRYLLKLRRENPDYFRTHAPAFMRAINPQTLNLLAPPQPAGEAPRPDPAPEYPQQDVIPPEQPSTAAEKAAPVMTREEYLQALTAATNRGATTKAKRDMLNLIRQERSTRF